MADSLRLPCLSPLCFNSKHSPPTHLVSKVTRALAFQLTLPHRISPSCDLKLPQRPFLIPRLTIKKAADTLSSIYLSSLSTLALALLDAEKAFAIGDVGQVSLGYVTFNRKIIYTILASEALALIGAAIGGILARQRKQELEKLNAQLRKINEYLRSKSMIETYAPGLVYSPVGRPLDNKRLDLEREELMRQLKLGKKLLKEKDPLKAYKEFFSALQLSQQIGDAFEEKKAARGLGTACQRLGKYSEAIAYHSMVLEISERTGEVSGNTEALGSIADCYCELGDFDTAQVYYKKYMDRLTLDDD